MVKVVLNVDQLNVRNMASSGTTARRIPHVITITRSRQSTPLKGGRGWRGAGKTPFFRKCSYASSCASKEVEN